MTYCTVVRRKNSKGRENRDHSGHFIRLCCGSGDKTPGHCTLYTVHCGLTNPVGRGPDLTGTWAHDCSSELFRAWGKEDG